MIMKNILVTGAGGFLGSYLVEHHLNKGDIVYGVDNFCSSDISSKHHRDLTSRKNYFFTRQDVTSSNFVQKHSSVEFDVIYNFACPASPPRYQEMPIETMMTCVVGTNNALSLASKKTVFIQASTSEVYGDPHVHPQPESYKGYVNSYGPRSCYDEGKRAAEALCFDHRQKRGIDARVVRIFNTYGPRMDLRDGRVITNLVCQALAGQQMTVYGNGQQTRSFCYVTDLIKGITAMAELSDNPGTPINIGNPNEFKILELVEAIQSKIGGDVRFVALPIDDPKQRKPDVSLAKKILNWEPTIDLDLGLDLMIDYVRTINAK